MAITVEEGKARRRAGVEAMTVAEKIRRDLTGGRPPESELKTPTAALIAAKTLLRKIETRIADETHGTGLKPQSFAVSVGFASPDLSVIGFTPLLIGCSPALDSHDEARIERALAGNIALGLIFGIADGEKILVGTRPFLVTKQTDALLSELTRVVQREFDLDGFTN
jgi:hypothetical protein